MRIVILLALSLLAVACSQGEDSVAPDATPRAEAQLVSIPRPDLADLPAPIARQLQEARDRLEEAGDESGSGELYGELGRLYHAYELPEVAKACYSNAGRLLPSDFRWPYLLAVLAEEAGELEEAAEKLRRVLELRPEGSAALVRLADVLQKTGLADEAEVLFLKALEADESNAFAHFGRGRIAYDCGDSQSAVHAFQRVLELQPEATRVHYPLALALRKIGRKEEAEEHLAVRGARPVERDDPLVEGLAELMTGVEPILDRAMAAQRAQRHEEAFDLYRQAIAMDPEHIGAQRRYASAQHQAGHLEEAIEVLDALLEKHPDHVMGRLELATIRLKREEVGVAIDILRSLTAEAPDLREAHANLGVALSQVGKAREAIASFEKALEVDPHYHEARFQMAKVLREMGLEKEAVSALETIVGAEPEHGPARQLLGALLLELGDFEGASKHHLAVLEWEGVPPEERAMAHFQLGLAAARSEDAEAAMGHYREAIKLFPDLWQARFNLANSLSRQARYDEACEELDQIVTASPANAVARTRQAEVLILAGHFDEARQALEEGLATLPGSIEIAHGLARLLATAPRADLRDGRRALDLAQTVFEARPSLLHAETIAMALAENGEFEKAVSWQRRLLESAEAEDSELPLERLRQELTLYESGRPMRLMAPDSSPS